MEEQQQENSSFLRKVPGFRSNSFPKKAIATVAYVFVFFAILGSLFGGKENASSQDSGPIDENPPNASIAVLSDLKSHYIDVGQADCILVQLPNDQTMLIDGGNEADSKTVLDYLSSSGIKTIDYLIATHPHEDHMGGLPAVIDALEIKSVYMPRASSNTRIFEKLLTSIQNKGLTVTTAKAGVNILSIPDLQIDVVAPVSDAYDNLNDYSAVVKMVFRNNSFLFTGDAETVSENQITDGIKADVLKVGHHGSDTSTSVSFLEKVNPSIAIISCGKDNSYGHPSDTVLGKLSAAGVDVYRTDAVGSIIVTSDGDNIKVDKAPTSYAPNAPPAPVSSPAASSVESSTGQNQSVTVYVTKTGSKYHVDGCQSLNKSKIAMSLSAAKVSYGPCSKCNPPR